jgi:hypothetical protein
MLISKSVDTVPNNDLMVDSWKVKYVNSPGTDRKLLRKQRNRNILVLSYPAEEIIWLILMK